MFSVFAPHLSYEVYYQITGKEIDKWPEFSFEDIEAYNEVEKFNKIVSEVRTYKIKNRMSIKQELDEWKADLSEELKEELSKTLNIKRVI
jgi:valyl-tRNA synthetase